VIRRLWSRFVFEQYATQTESLAMYRSMLAAWLLAFRVPQFQWIAGYPSVFLDPPVGPTAFFFTGFPPSSFFSALDAVSIGALVFLLMGRRVLAAASVFTVCQIVGQSWMYSFGKINHEILLVLTPLFLALAERESRTTKTGWPLALFAFTLSIAMFTAAAAKATTGWLDPTASGTLGHGIANALGAAGRDNAAWQFAINTLPFPIWKAMDYMAVGMEASFVVTVFWRRTFLASVALACLFHLGVATLMRIQFVNVYAYGSFVSWAFLLGSVGLLGWWGRVEQWLARRSTASVLMVAATYAAVCLVWRNPVSFAWLAVGGINPSLVVTWIAALMGGLYLLAFPVRLVSRRPGQPQPILFDGVCGLCNAWVDFVLSVDRDGRYRFVALQSDTGQQMLGARGLPANYTASIVLVDGDRTYLRSDAILRILAGLGGLWRMALVGRLLPTALRDWAYDAVAENRYKWFGRREVCRMPTPSERSRFLL
jgi:predicted DCC family thiol-disulfide oxidoreductase YuxK